MIYFLDDKRVKTSIATVLLMMSLLLSVNAQHSHVRSEGLMLGLAKKGDFKGSVSLVNPFIFSRAGYAISAGYSPLRHLGAVVSHGWQLNNEGGENTSNSFHVDGAIGTYVLLKIPDRTIGGELKEGKGHILLDFYFGYGKGNVHQNFTNFIDGEAIFRQDRYFFQPGFHLVGSKFKFSYTLKRVNQLTYKGLIEGKPTPRVTRFINNLREENTFVYIEQTIQARIIRGPIEYSATLLYNPESINSVSIALGATFDLGRLLIKDKVEQSGEKDKKRKKKKRKRRRR